MEFLPTVTIAPLWFGIAVIAVFGMFIISILAMGVSLVFKKNIPNPTPLLVGTMVSMIILMVVSGIFTIINGHNAEDNLNKNLSQKYDIVSVDYDSKIATLRIDSAKSQLITVNLKNGKQGSFLLTQDARTNEPTLSELPESAVHVEDITK